MPIPHGSVANIGGEHWCVRLIRIRKYVGYDPAFVREGPSPIWTGLRPSRGPYTGRICRILFPSWSCGSKRSLGMCESSPIAFSFGLVILPRSASSILPGGETSRQWMWMWLVLFGVVWINRLRWTFLVFWIRIRLREGQFRFPRFLCPPEVLALLQRYFLCLFSACAPFTISLLPSRMHGKLGKCKDTSVVKLIPYYWRIPRPSTVSVCVKVVLGLLSVTVVSLIFFKKMVGGDRQFYTLQIEIKFPLLFLNVPGSIKNLHLVVEADDMQQGDYPKKKKSVADQFVTVKYKSETYWWTQKLNGKDYGTDKYWGTSSCCTRVNTTEKQ